MPSAYYVCCIFVFVSILYIPSPFRTHCIHQCSGYWMGHAWVTEDLHPSNNYSVMLGWVFLEWFTSKQGIKCLAQSRTPCFRLPVPSCCIFSKVFQTTFTMEANTMNPDQTATLVAVWSGSIMFSIYRRNLTTWADERADDNCRKWLAIIMRNGTNFQLIAAS